jgi:hypothetical protein
MKHQRPLTTSVPPPPETIDHEKLLPKSFLQLCGISVGNFNMGCNFNSGSAIKLMMRYELSVLAIQEHTPWSRQLSDAEINSIQRYCNYWGFAVIISKVQILITDKQLTACI